MEALHVHVGVYSVRAGSDPRSRKGGSGYTPYESRDSLTQNDRMLGVFNRNIGEKSSQ